MGAARNNFFKRFADCQPWWLDAVLRQPAAPRRGATSCGRRREAAADFRRSLHPPRLLEELLQEEDLLLEVLLFQEELDRPTVEHK